MKLGFFTDLHLNYAEEDDVIAFLAELPFLGMEAMLITGDTAEAPSICHFLERIAQSFYGKIYFVLGNHCYWHSSISETRHRIRNLCKENSQLIWLNDAGIIPLTEKTALIGHDSWYDGVWGNAERSNVYMNDWDLTTELKCPAFLRLDRCKALAKEAKDHYLKHLPKALHQYDEVILAQHVPPFREASTYKGKMSDDNWMPWFSCATVGEFLLKTMSTRQSKQLTVYCGHSHGHADVKMAPNLRVRTGAARYCSPKMVELITVE